MKNKYLVYFTILSFLCWLFLFVLRLGIEFPEINIEYTENQNLNPPKIVNEIIESLSENDRKDVFITIFKNNLKVCIFNIAGGITFGLGTLINLSVNGFYTADIVVASFNSGFKVPAIIQLTLPHAFELIGLWLSGGVGFFVAWNIIQVMRGKEGFTKYFYKQTGICFIVIFLITLAAAYVETYVSLS